METKNHVRFTAIIDKVAGTIKSVLLRSFSDLPRQDREDLMQEILIKIWRLLASGKKVDRLSLYVRRMTYSIAVDYVRTMNRKSPRNVISWKFEKEAVRNVPALGEGNPEAGLRTQEFLKSVRDAIGALIESRQRVIRLHLLGLHIDEIASYLGWSSNRVRHLLYRGLDDLRAKFKEMGIDLEAQTKLGRGKNQASRNDKRNR